jgi:phenylalanyl-tRNA synthetase beta chain
MLVSYRWLKELLPRLDREAEEVAEALSAIGLAVDGVSDGGGPLRSLVLAEVVRVERHPNRDKLKLVTVRLQPPDSATLSRPPSPRGALALPAEVTVVCGANNVPAPGGLVVFAGLGTKLPGVDFVLERRELGGVISEGMLCSEAELGLTDESSGLLTYPKGSWPLGTRLVDACPEVRDVIFELDITPNRPDALGHVGVARDLAAYFEIELVLPDCTPAAGAALGGGSIALAVSLKNNTPARCPRYGLGLVRGVKVGPSPDYMRYRLHRLGVRPISNVVDITNWIMLEWGQPLHAFDLKKVAGPTIEIRQALEQETLTTLDGVSRSLNPDDVVICDATQALAVAGVMGGKDSEITASTADVLIECAYFDPRSVRRTSRRLGIHSESSHRFERGTDFGATGRVLERAKRLMQELCGGHVAPGELRDDGTAPEVPAIELRSERMAKLLGVDIPFNEATRILGRLGISVEFMSDVGRGGSVARLRGASHRPDVQIEADLIEEVARIRGLDNIPTELPSIPPQMRQASGVIERNAMRHAVSLGLSETLTYSFVSRRELEALGAPAPVVELQNPLSEERNVMRTSLLPGLLEAVRRSRRRAERRVRLFAVGAIFLPISTPNVPVAVRTRTRDDKQGLPYERPTFAAVLAGPRDDYGVVDPEDVDVYSAKAVAVEMIERLTGQTAQVTEASTHPKTAHLHPRGRGLLRVRETEVGSFGPLHPDIEEALDLDGPVMIVELDLAALETLGEQIPRYQPLPKIPPVTRDISLVVKDEYPAERIQAGILGRARPLCESVEVRAEFRGGSVPRGSRSLTFRLRYRDPEAQGGKDGRTLTDQEVDEVQSRVLEQVAVEFGATLRA